MCKKSKSGLLNEPLHFLLVTYYVYSYGLKMVLEHSGVRSIDIYFAGIMRRVRNLRLVPGSEAN